MIFQYVSLEQKTFEQNEYGRKSRVSEVVTRLARDRLSEKVKIKGIIKVCVKTLKIFLKQTCQRQHVPFVLNLSMNYRWSINVFQDGIEFYTE